MAASKGNEMGAMPWMHRRIILTVPGYFSKVLEPLEEFVLL